MLARHDEKTVMKLCRRYRHRIVIGAQILGLMIGGVPDGCRLAARKARISFTWRPSGVNVRCATCDLASSSEERDA